MLVKEEAAATGFGGGGRGSDYSIHPKPHPVPCAGDRSRGGEQDPGVWGAPSGTGRVDQEPAAMDTRSAIGSARPAAAPDRERAHGPDVGRREGAAESLLSIPVVGRI